MSQVGLSRWFSGSGVGRPDGVLREIPDSFLCMKPLGRGRSSQTVVRRRTSTPTTQGGMTALTS